MPTDRRWRSCRTHRIEGRVSTATATRRRRYHPTFRYRVQNISRRYPREAGFVHRTSWFRCRKEGMGVNRVPGRRGLPSVKTRRRVVPPGTSRCGGTLSTAYRTSLPTLGQFPFERRYARRRRRSGVRVQGSDHRFGPFPVCSTVGVCGRGRAASRAACRGYGITAK